MLAFLNRHVVQPLVAAKRRSRHLDYLRFLERTQFDPPAVVRGRQLAMLKAILRHAFDTVPHYRRAWRTAGVHPTDLRTLADLAHFPTVSKADLRTRGDEFLSTAFDPKSLRTKRTSGSTGVPLTVRLDERGAQWKTACTLRADGWSGWRRGQRVAKVWGNPEYRRYGLRGRLTNAVLDRAAYLDTLHLTDDRVRDFVADLRRRPPGLVFGHAHSLYLLACWLKRNRIDDVRPNGVIATAMPLPGWQRAVIEQVFGVLVSDRYGCEEVSLIACECERHRGLHVAAESVHVEVGPAGQLLLTDLSNFGMPLIRYRVGDVATAADRICPCGRGLPMLESVQGRDADFVLTPAGGFVSGISLTENFALLVPGAAQMQIVQDAVTALRIRLVPDGRLTDDARGRIAELVRDTFGPAMRHAVEVVDAIPAEPTGKFRFCVSQVAADRLRELAE